MIAAVLRWFLANETALPEPLPRGVRVYRSSWIPALAGWLSGMRGPAAVVTLGDAIVVYTPVPITPRLLRHELEHVRQWEEAPLLFPARYALGHLRYGYNDNPYEVAARVAEQLQPRAGRLPDGEAD